MDTFPMSAQEARIAAREDEYENYLVCLRLAAAHPHDTDADEEFDVFGNRRYG